MRGWDVLITGVQAAIPYSAIGTGDLDIDVLDAYIAFADLYDAATVVKMLVALKSAEAYRESRATVVFHGKFQKADGSYSSTYSYQKPGDPAAEQAMFDALTVVKEALCVE